MMESIDQAQLDAWRDCAREDQQRAFELDGVAFIETIFEAIYGWLPGATPQQTFEDRLKQLLLSSSQDEIMKRGKIR